MKKFNKNNAVICRTLCKLQSVLFLNYFKSLRRKTEKNKYAHRKLKNDLKIKRQLRPLKKHISSLTDTVLSVSAEIKAFLIYFAASGLPYSENMTSPSAEYLFHLHLKLFKKIRRNKGLNRTCKPSAMYA